MALKQPINPPPKLAHLFAEKLSKLSPLLLILLMPLLLMLLQDHLIMAHSLEIVV